MTGEARRWEAKKLRLRLFSAAVLRRRSSFSVTTERVYQEVDTSRTL